MEKSIDTKKRTILAILGILLIGAISIGATLAFMTDAQTVTNTFTVGDIEITLDEPNYPDPEPPFTKEGDSYPKDPTVTGASGECYMRITVEFIENDPESPDFGKRIIDPVRIAKIWQTLYYDAEGDFVLGNPDVKYDLIDLVDLPHYNAADFTKDLDRCTDGMEYYVYNGIFSEGDTATLFTSVIVPYDWEYDDLMLAGTYSVVIQAEAIQTHNFENATDAFDALDTEIANGTVYNTGNNSISENSEEDGVESSETD